MAPTHTDVVDSDLALVAPPEHELAHLWSDCEEMNVSGGILVEGHGLQEDVVILSLRGDLVDKIDNLVNGLPDFEGVWVHRFADFAFEFLPVERSDVGVSGVGFLLLLGEHPTLEALEMDESNRSSAFASQNKWVLRVLFVTPANSALHLVGSGIIDVLGSSDLHSLSEFLLIKLALRHLETVASEVLDSESDSSQFDGVKLLDLVVVLAVLVLERSGN